MNPHLVQRAVWLAGITLIAALIALAIVVGATSLGNSLNNQFGRIAGKLDATGN